MHQIHGYLNAPLEEDFPSVTFDSMNKISWVATDRNVESLMNFPAESPVASDAEKRIVNTAYQFNVQTVIVGYMMYLGVPMGNILERKDEIDKVTPEQHLGLFLVNVRSWAYARYRGLFLGDYPPVTKSDDIPSLTLSQTDMEFINSINFNRIYAATVLNSQLDLSDALTRGLPCKPNISEQGMQLIYAGFIHFLGDKALVKYIPQNLSTEVEMVLDNLQKIAGLGKYKPLQTGEAVSQSDGTSKEPVLNAPGVLESYAGFRKSLGDLVEKARDVHGDSEELEELEGLVYDLRTDMRRVLMAASALEISMQMAKALPQGLSDEHYLGMRGILRRDRERYRDRDRQEGRTYRRRERERERDRLW